MAKINPKRKRTRPPADVPPPQTVTLPPSGYQPSKAEMEEEIDMPDMDDDQIRETFFRQFKFTRKSK